METFFVAKVSVHLFFRLSPKTNRGPAYFGLFLGMENNSWFKKYLPKEPFRWKKVIQYFLQGLLIIAPLAITIYAIYWVVSTVDNWVPIFRETVRDEDGKIVGHEVKNYGLGFLIILAAVIIIGYLSSFFIQSRLFNLFDRWLEKTPGVKFIYTSTRDFFEAFAGDKKRFNKSVLANVFSEDVWIIGFLTDEEMQKFDLGADKVAVYVPQAYNFAGQLYVLPRSKVKKIEKISSGEAMKYAVTGGVVDLDDERKEILKKLD